jgi:hypothetical protein
MSIEAENECSWFRCISIIAAAPAGLENGGLLVAPQLFQRWGSDWPNLKPLILHLDRASGPLFFYHTLRELFHAVSSPLDGGPTRPGVT